MGKPQNKRPGQSLQGPAKKRKLSTRNQSSKAQVKSKGKDHAFDRGVIPIPKTNEPSDEEILTDEDLEFFNEHGDAQFLQHLNANEISKSKKEIARLHQFTKPLRKAAPGDDLPPVDSHSEDEEQWSSGLDASNMSACRPDESEDSDSDISTSSDVSLDSDDEMPYEVHPRNRLKDREEVQDTRIQGLPIKLADGRIQQSGVKIVSKRHESDQDNSGDEHDEVEAGELETERKVEDVSTGARFGRPAVVDVVMTKSRKARIDAAKEQIASICQEIISDPENSLGLLRRLYTFCLAEISSSSHPQPVANDPLIRKLAILSQLAVFKDVIPGYRIRPLTEKEKAEKVSQIVQRTRDFEQGLIGVYQSYLRVLEAELKLKSNLAEVALQSICRLLTAVTHFNFRVNLMSAVVARLSKKSWDESSDLCLQTLISVLRADVSGEPSLEIVRLLNRMIKERRFNVHPNVLSCLLHLRLKTELGGVRASESKADKDKSAGHLSKGKAASRRAKGKATNQPHLSKKAKKKAKETQGIMEEMREAEAEVDRDEKANMQTETLKLLFVLYFRILKLPNPSPLLGAALRGISRFAHLVNIDFFKDLMQVLKDLIARGSKFDHDASEQDDNEDPATNQDSHEMIHRLQCIVTAFELLTGQGEALNIDLSDFVNRLYAIILPLSALPGVEEPAPNTRGHSGVKSHVGGDSPADMLFRALNLVFTPRASASTAPPWRSAAFAKRLMTAALHFPPTTARRSLVFVESLLAKEPRVEALLSTEERVADGVYRPDIDDPQLCNPFGTAFWEVHLIERSHVDTGTRELAGRLRRYVRET
ncbi:nucleolar complex-associated protein 3 [Rickenella mellea]|uniref:Nucleolar complex-associated protein 3 n=1 Tax=Rickenella mellea TaxID=50990 RepID=A0A4Y7QL37_9AGAM|nr:nucleolar complex-associated protein 3 [Rickenella mellea]